MNDLFTIGHFKIGNYLLWVTEPIFTDLKTIGLYDINKHFDLDYYDCSLTELKEYQDSSGKVFTCHYYINLVDKLKQYDSYFNFARPDKDINDEKELHHWVSNKDLQMPLWRLRKSTIQKIINFLLKFNAEGTSLLSSGV